MAASGSHFLHRPLWQRYALLVTFALIVYPLLPRGSTTQSLFYDLIGALSIGAMLHGVNRHRSMLARPWLAFALGTALAVGGDVFWTVREIVVGGDPPFPWIADLVYLASYPALALGLIDLGRRRRPARDLPSLIDALIVVVGAGSLMWVYLILPNLRTTSLGLDGRIVAATYPAMDLLLLGVAARFLGPGGLRRPALAFLVAGIVAMIGADVVYGMGVLNGTYHSGDLIDLGWLLSYSAFGLAALHPSMVQAGDPDPDRHNARLSPYRLLGLAVIALSGPAVLIVRGWEGESSDVIVIAAAAGTLFLLAMTRVGGLALGLDAALRRGEAMEGKLRHLANHDPLTGLPNRSFFGERIAQATTDARLNGTTVAVLMLDLDRFKLVNDELGHAAGDALLIAVSRRLAQAVRSTDTLARLGGDEFAVLITNLDGPATAALIANRVLAAFTDPITIDGRALYAGTSIGVAVSSPELQSPADLLRLADLALYRAKRAGRGVALVYDPTDSDPQMEWLELEADLRRAVDAGQFVLHYQPVVSLRSGKILAVESLIRWQHPRRGLLLPGEFLPLAEETGLIGVITDWALKDSCRQLAVWREKLGPLAPPQVSVNLAVRDLRVPGLAQRVLGAVAQTGISPRDLRLEISEQALVTEVQAAASELRTLRQAGVHLDIDDFGAGASSLASLRAIDVAVLKLDRAFVRGLTVNDDDRRIVEAITAMAHALGLQVTAEGIETHDELAAARSAGCDRAQGFLFGRPMPIDECEEWLRETRRFAAIIASSRTVAA